MRAKSPHCKCPLKDSPLFLAARHIAVGTGAAAHFFGARLHVAGLVARAGSHALSRDAKAKETNNQEGIKIFHDKRGLVRGVLGRLACLET